VLRVSISSSPLRSQTTIAAERHRSSARLLPAGLQRRKDLPDSRDVIGRVSRGGESGGSAHVVPTRARGDDLPPFVGFVAETVAQSSPLILGNRGALPTGVPVGAGPRIRLARRPAVQDGEAETNVIDVRGDGRFSGHGTVRRPSPRTS